MDKALGYLEEVAIWLVGNKFELELHRRIRWNGSLDW
jgi:hypothetical protein